MHVFERNRSVRRHLSSRLEAPLLGMMLGFAALASGPATAGPAPEARQPQEGQDEVKTIKGAALGLELSVQHFVMENGLRVYVLEDHASPIYAAHLSFSVGAKDEPPGKTGLAHFFEGMMFRGSEAVPDGGHVDYILDAGGQVNSFTTPDVTQFHHVLPSNRLDLGLWLEADRMRSLALNEDTFESQRQKILEQRRTRVDETPYTQVILGFLTEIWSGTGYSHAVFGSQQDLENLTIEDALAFFGRHYVPANATLAIVGDVDPVEVRNKVEQYFADIAGGEPHRSKSEVDHAQKKIERRVEDPRAQQPLILVGWKTVPSGHQDRPALDVLARILLDGESSRLHQRLVEDKKLAAATVSLASLASGGRDAGAMLGGFIPVAGVTLDELRPVIRSEVAELSRRGVSAKELERAVNNMSFEALQQLATNDYRALMISKSSALHGEPLGFMDELARYQKVSARDIKRVATTYLTENWLALEITPKQ